MSELHDPQLDFPDWITFLKRDVLGKYREGGKLAAQKRCRFYGIPYDTWEKEFSKEITFANLTRVCYNAQKKKT